MPADPPIDPTAEDEATFAEPIRRWFWPLVLLCAATVVVLVPCYIASNREGDSGIRGLHGPGGSVFGNTYMPVLPLLLLGLLVLVWNPLWRWLARCCWAGARHLVVRGRELLLLCLVLYAVVAAWNTGYLKHLFVNENLADVAGKNDTYTDLKAGLPTCLGFPARDDSRQASPPDEAAIRLVDGLLERGESTLASTEFRFADLSVEEQARLQEVRREQAERLELADRTPYAADDMVGIDQLAGRELYRLRWQCLTTPVPAARPGAPPGDSPLAVALRPTLGTALLIVIAAAAVVGFIAMTARQWVHHERLQYPLVQVPVALARPSLIRNRGFQVAFLIVVAVVLYNFAKGQDLHPLPHFPYGIDGDRPVVRMEELYKMFGMRMPAGARWLYKTWWGSLNLSALAIGIAFLIVLDVGFTLWSGFFFGAMICGWLYQAGVPVNYQHHGRMIGGGATLAMAAVVLWIGRHHYWRLLKAAVGIGRREVADRAGVWGLRVLLLACFVFSVVLILLMHGFDPWSPASLHAVWDGMTPFTLFRATVGTAISMVVFLAVIIVTARVIAETGLAHFELPIRFNSLLVTMGLPYAFPAPILALMGWIGLHMGTTHANGVGFLVQAIPMGERAAVRQRRLLPLIFGLVAFTIVVGIVVFVIAWWVIPGAPQRLTGTPYREMVRVYENLRLAGEVEPDVFIRAANGLGLEEGFPRHCFQYLSFLTRGANGPLFNAFLIGAGLIFGCYILRRMWVGFPLNPLGVVVAVSWPIYQIWGSLLLGWLAKVLVLRYGGSQLYTRLKPVAIGLIFGEAFAVGVVVVIRSCIFYF